MFEVPILSTFRIKFVWYNRIHTSSLGTLTLSKNNAINVSDLIDDINAALNTSILVSEIDDFVLPLPDTLGKVSFQLLFNNTSFRYYSSPKTVIRLPDTERFITKETLGLGKVDNTSDLSKPVSLAELQLISDTRTSIEQYVLSHPGNDSHTPIVTPGVGIPQGESIRYADLLIPNASVITGMKPAVGTTLLDVVFPPGQWIAQGKAWNFAGLTINLPDNTVCYLDGNLLTGEMALVSGNPANIDPPLSVGFIRVLQVVTQNGSVTDSFGFDYEGLVFKEDLIIVARLRQDALINNLSAQIQNIINNPQGTSINAGVVAAGIVLTPVSFSSLNIVSLLTGTVSAIGTSPHLCWLTVNWGIEIPAGNNGFYVSFNAPTGYRIVTIVPNYNTFNNGSPSLVMSVVLNASQVQLGFYGFESSSVVRSLYFQCTLTVSNQF